MDIKVKKRNGRLQEPFHLVQKQRREGQEPFHQVLAKKQRKEDQ